MRFINPIPFVRNIEISKDFYQNTIGLKIIKDFGNFILFDSGFAIHDGHALEQTIWQKTFIADQPYGRKNLLLYFEHPDIEFAFESIAPHVELIHPLEKQPWGQRVFRFYDPDQHVIEVGEPQIIVP